MTPSFNVPAQCFYALTANLPIDVGVDVRYQTAVTASSKRIVDTLHAAIDDGVISATLSITPEQAARRLGALGSAGGAAPVCKSGVGSVLLSTVLPEVGWLDYTSLTPTNDPVADIAPFWSTVLAPLIPGNLTLSHPTLARAHLELIVCAIINESDPAPLIGAVQAEGISLNSVKDLDPQAFGAPPMSAVFR